MNILFVSWYKMGLEGRQGRREGGAEGATCPGPQPDRGAPNLKEILKLSRGSLSSYDQLNTQMNLHLKTQNMAFPGL